MVVNVVEVGGCYRDMPVPRVTKTHRGDARPALVA
jgi:hypothetical protein